MPDDDGLFTGTDDADRPGPPPGQTSDPLQGSDPVGLKPWLDDLTYDEVHAFTVGFAPMWTGLLLLPFMPRAATSLLALAALLTSAAVVEKHRPTKALRYIVREVHYYLGGQAIAATLGIGWVGLVGVLTHLGGALA
ncbi:hypothetical protein K745_gp05 [Haloarcula hispanica virus PH1]|uniref:Uncharacterized protein n=1 Tax=Haloarcula hispanica virus PH1 TaxID=1282967 RepID=M4JGF9_9VIRU|nr:hypothetical protein K745_gp05 [Haloarcula hispanica virus PH1]AGC65530.1 hypothetical protein HhPH1_gp05 [Haloarcula hispanica virus PH1]